MFGYVYMLLGYGFFFLKRLVGFWIVSDVWIKLWKNEFLAKNKHDFEFLMK